MIAKQVQGSDFTKVLNYIHNKLGARRLASNTLSQEPQSLAVEFQLASRLRSSVTKCVYHASISVSPSENLSDRQWVEIARAYLRGMEFNGNQYVIYRHTDTQHDHIHIVANRIRITDGSVVNDSWQYRRAEMVLRQLEEQFGLSRTPCSWEKNKRAPTTGEIRRQRRTGEVNKRSQLQALIKQSLNSKPPLDEFIRRLSDKGVSVRLIKSEEGKIEGISYKLDDIAFQGRQLGKDFAWTSLESVLAKETTYAIAFPAQPVPLPSSTLAADNQEAESKELEQRKENLRAKYVSLASQIRQLPQFQPRETRDIDLGVTLLLLKAGESLEEAKMVLTQSDRVRQWHQELPKEAFLDVAKQYIRQVANKASELRQKHRGREKGVEWE